MGYPRASQTSQAITKFLPVYIHQVINIFLLLIIILMKQVRHANQVTSDCRYELYSANVFKTEFA